MAAAPCPEDLIPRSLTSLAPTLCQHPHLEAGRNLEKESTNTPGPGGHLRLTQPLLLPQNFYICSWWSVANVGSPGFTLKSLSGSSEMILDIELQLLTQKFPPGNLAE